MEKVKKWIRARGKNHMAFYLLAGAGLLYMGYDLLRGFEAAANFRTVSVIAGVVFLLAGAAALALGVYGTVMLNKEALSEAYDEKKTDGPEAETEKTDDGKS